MAKKISRIRLNPTEVKKLYNKHKNVGTVAEELGASYMGIRRNLLAQGVELVPIRSARTVEASTANSKTVGKATAVESITRAVAHSLAGDAPLQLPPMTRSDFFETVRAAVSQATRQVGFRKT